MAGSGQSEMGKRGKILEYTTNSLEELKQQGIYMVYHLDALDGGCYVGLCRSNPNRRFNETGFYGRWRIHLAELGRGEHYCEKLQLLVNDFGVDRVRFEILEIVVDDSSLDSREIFWINQKQSYVLGYNKTSGGESNYTYSEEAKSMLRKSSYMAGRVGSLHRASIPIYQYDLEGNFIQMWESGRLAGRTLGIYEGSVRSVLKGSQLQSKGYRWFYEFLGDKINPIKARENKLKKVAKLDVKTLEILDIFPSVTDAAKSVGILEGTGAISAACKLEKVSKGFRWRYVLKDE